MVVETTDPTCRKETYMLVVLKVNKEESDKHYMKQQACIRGDTETTRNRF